MKILHLDSSHPVLLQAFKALGFENDEDYTATKAEVERKIHTYDGVVIRNRFSLDRAFLDKATELKFVAQLCAELETVDVPYAKQRNIFLASAPEATRNAVAEHTLGMLLALLNTICKANRELKAGSWDRAGNHGVELDGKTVGIIGYGNMGKAFAKKLQGFEVNVICYDSVGGVGDKNARQVGIMEFQHDADVVSLHLPQTERTAGMVNTEFIDKFHKPFWLLNTGWGNCVVTADLVAALQSGKVLGAGLDVLEYEGTSFETSFVQESAAFAYLKKAENVVLTPHVAGCTAQSHEKIAQTLVAKVRAQFC